MRGAARIVILGLGQSGQATAHYCLRHAAELGLQELCIVDSNDTSALVARAAELSRYARDCANPCKLTLHLGATVLPDATHYDLAITSPGISPMHPLTQTALTHSDELISELEFAFRCSDKAHRWLAITGTNGKTTATSVLTHILQQAGRSAVSVGNIGQSALDVLDKVSKDAWFVAEVSSFQLEHTRTFAPFAAAFLNISPDHLDWHGSFDAYRRAKLKIFAHQKEGAYAFFPAEEEESFSDNRVIQQGVHVVQVGSRRLPGPSCYIAEDALWIHLEHDAAAQRICTLDELPLKGAPLCGDALFAAGMAAVAGCTRAELAAGLTSFVPISHRLELVAEVAKVRYVDDSKATNPDAVLAALKAFESEEIVLLLGGKNKGVSFDSLADEVRKRVKNVVFFGEDGRALRGEFCARYAVDNTSPLPQLVFERDFLKACVHASRIARPGAVVLLAPGATSWDDFADYAQRGDFFRGYVAGLADKVGDAK